MFFYLIAPVFICNSALFLFFVLFLTPSRKLRAMSLLNAAKEMNPHDVKRLNHFQIGYLLLRRWVLFRTYILTSLQTCSP